MIENWMVFLSNKRRLIFFILLVASGFFSVSMFSKFMIWNETRPGMAYSDPILALMDPLNLSRITMPLTLIPIFIGMVLIFMNPKNTTYFFFSAFFICVLRSLTMLLVPLEPPIGIIPLTDPIIEKLFYGGQVLEKDLFFSGHTANLVLIGLLLGDKRRKRIFFFIACIVGLLLMWQRVHYSFDVFAAPFFAYLAYRLSVYAGDKTLLKSSELLNSFGDELESDVSLKNF
jgi:hypothetical protein